MTLQRDSNGAAMQLFSLGSASDAATAPIGGTSTSIAMPQGIDAIRIVATVACTVTATVGAQYAVYSAGVLLVQNTPDVFAVPPTATHLNVVTAGQAGSINIAW